jgi:hypothetical protein
MRTATFAAAAALVVGSSAAAALNPRQVINAKVTDTLVLIDHLHGAQLAFAH